MTRLAAVLLLAAGAATLRAQLAKQAKPFEAQAVSHISYHVKDGAETVEIVNVAYDIGGVPGQSGFLVLRKTEKTTQVIGDMGMEGSVTMEAWPLGSELSKKPLYQVTATGTDARILEDEVWMVDRSTDPDVRWWSLYRLGTGQHLFDSYVEPLRLTVSRSDGNPRYAGLEVPPDDTSDARLKEAHVVGVLSYASGERVIREALITCDNPTRARDLRMYEDTERKVSVVDGAAGRAIRISFRSAYPSAANEVAISVPQVKDDLDVAHAQLPAGMHIAAWRR